MSNALFLCLVIPEFPAQALLRLRPTLRKTPVAVLEGTAPLETVASVNRLARRLSVERGMRKTELSSFPALMLLRRSTTEEQVARGAIFDIAATFTPRMEEAASNRDHGSLVLVLDITGSERLFGSPAVIARRLLEGLRSVHIAARCAISSNFSAAVCLARAATRRICVIPAEETASALAPLPLSALPLSPEQAETLSLWGLRSLGELAALSRLDLVTRLGSAGERLHQLAQGTAPHLMVPAEPPLALEEAIEFDTAVDTIDSLLFVLGPMLDALIIRAGAHALELSSVTAHMTLEASSANATEGGGFESPNPDQEPPTHVRTLKPALPVADRRLLLKLFQLDLAAHPPAAGVLLLRLTAEPGARSKIQTGLFTPQTPEPMRLEVTLARLAALVGEDRVGRPELSNAHTPESFSIRRFTVPEAPFPRMKSRKPGNGTRHADKPKSSSLRRNQSPQQKSHVRNRPRPATAPAPITLSSAQSLTPALSARSPKTLATSQATHILTPVSHDPACPGSGFSDPGFWSNPVYPGAHRAGIALRRFRPPIPISPRSEAGALLAFYFQGTRYEVRERFGPWRRSGHWWSGEIWSREEWDIHAEAPRPTQTGTSSHKGSRLLCLISHDLLHDRWHMDALYD